MLIEVQLQIYLDSFFTNDLTLNSYVKMQNCTK